MDLMGGIGNIFKAIGQIGKNIGASISDSMHQIRLHRKTSNKFDVDIKIIRNHHQISNYKGKLTPNQQMAFVPAVERPIFYPSIYDDDKGQLIICSERQHDNLSHAKLIQMEAALKLKQNIKWRLSEPNTRKLEKIIKENGLFDKILDEWKYDDVWMTIQTENQGSSIDYTLLGDNKYSISFATHSNQVMNSEHFKFLLKPSDMTVLTTLIMGLLCGAFLGYILRGG
jgi:hypothetical protein